MKYFVQKLINNYCKLLFLFLFEKYFELDSTKALKVLSDSYSTMTLFIVLKLLGVFCYNCEQTKKKLKI